MLDEQALDGALLLQAQVPAAQVDPFRFAKVGHLYLSTFSHVRELKQMELKVGGWRAVPGCASMGFGVSDEAQAQEAAEEISQEVGRSGAKPFRDLAAALMETSATLPLLVRMEKSQWTTGLTAAPAPRPRVTRELIDRRVVIEKVGGKPAVVRVHDPRSGRSVTLKADEEQAKTAGLALYQKADIHAYINYRVDDMRPVGGELLHIRPLEDEPLTFDGMKAWWTGRYSGRA